MRIFVIGATGVIGRRVLPRLVAAGHDVSAFSRSSVNRNVIERAGARAVETSLLDAATLSTALRGHEVVINLATSIPSASRALLPGAFRKTNALRRELPPRIAHAAREAGVRRFIQESFAPVYPDRGDAWIDESVALTPVRQNNAVIDAEAAALSFGDAVVLRFAYFYGDDSDFTQQMIATIRKGWSPLPGRPEAYMSSVSHDDAADAVVAALDLPRGVYNVVDDEPVTRRDFAGSLAARLGAPPPKFPPAWTARLFGSLGEMLARSQRISNRKLRNASSWRPHYPSVREAWPAIIPA